MSSSSLIHNLGNYSSCVVQFICSWEKFNLLRHSCTVCISTLASSAFTSNQHTNKTSNYVHYHQEIQARVQYSEDVQHVKLCETWASFGQVIFSQWGNLVENNLMTQFKLMHYFDGQNLKKFRKSFMVKKVESEENLKFPLAFDGECKADFCQL